jgi:hypothetical protein
MKTTTDLRIASEAKMASTTVLIEAETERGCDFLARHCGSGAVSIVVPKSQLQAVADCAYSEGVILR